jgi:REP element-mobilizing transposase RayT
LSDNFGTIANMARSIRIEFEGALYHVMARGNRKEPIFLDEEDCRMFLKTLGEACSMTGWRIPAWVLMRNHYHLMLTTPEANLVEGMKWLQNTYTRRFNVRHSQWGRLFGDRYKSVLVEGQGYYYETLMDYIHLNPARAGLIDPEKGRGVLDYPWCSVAGGYALSPKKRPVWLAAVDGLAAFGFSDTAEGRRGFVRRLDERVVREGLEKAGVPEMGEEVDRRLSRLDRGWYWGSEVFAERVLKLGESVLSRNRHPNYRGSQEAQAHGEREAVRLLEEGLKLAGISKEELEEVSGSDLRKVALAELIARRTTVGMGWISRTLNMRSASNASQQIRRFRHAEKFNLAEKIEKTLPGKFKKWLKQSYILA